MIRDEEFRQLRVDVRVDRHMMAALEADEGPRGLVVVVHQGLVLGAPGVVVADDVDAPRDDGRPDELGPLGGAEREPRRHGAAEQRHEVELLPALLEPADEVRGRLGALREPHDADERAPAVEHLDEPPEVRPGPRLDLAVLVREPPLIRLHALEEGQDAGARPRVHEPVHVHELEVRLEKAAEPDRLDAEDVGARAAAVETEDLGQHRYIYVYIYIYLLQLASSGVGAFSFFTFAGIVELISPCQKCHPEPGEEAWAPILHKPMEYLSLGTVRCAARDDTPVACGVPIRLVPFITHTKNVDSVGRRICTRHHALSL